MKNELDTWERLGVEPNQIIAFNPLKNDIWLQSITKFLSEKGIINEDEFVVFYKEHMLSELQKVRTELVEPEVRKSRIIRPHMEVPRNKGKMH